jgi:methylated-DNA-[protein]-cysteine S-methyltransferase
MEFKERVFRIVKKMPKGRVSTYAEVGRALGTRGFRAVGNALNKSPGIKKGVPCHRVVRSDGKVGGFALGTTRKIEMLKSEGIGIINGKVDLGKYFYRLEKIL